MMRAVIDLDGHQFDVKLEPMDSDEADTAGPPRWRATVDGEAFEVVAREPGIMESGGSMHTVALAGDQVIVNGSAAKLCIEHLDGVAGAQGAAAGDGTIRPPMNGTIADVLVSPGDAVGAGDVLFVLEAMKMQNQVKAPMAGTVADVGIKVGETVVPAQVAIRITAA